MNTKGTKKPPQVKSSVPAFVVFAVLLCDTLGANGQGTFEGVFDLSNNGINGGARAPIYGPDPSNLSLQLWGNPPTAYPPGTQIYGGIPLSGTNFSVQGWYSTNAVPGSTQLLAGGKNLKQNVEPTR